MQHSRFWAAAAIIAVLIVAGFALSVPHTRDVGETAKAPVVATTTPAVTLSDTYRKGTHTLSGTVTAPNACTTLTATATTTELASSSPITLSLTMPEDTGLCLQVPTRIPFSVKVEALEGAPVSVTVNGVPATTTSP